jgi:hypothetical protein
VGVRNGKEHGKRYHGTAATVPGKVKIGTARADVLPMPMRATLLGIVPILPRLWEGETDHEGAHD